MVWNEYFRRDDVGKFMALHDNIFKIKITFQIKALYIIDDFNFTRKHIWAPVTCTQEEAGGGRSGRLYLSQRIWCPTTPSTCEGDPQNERNTAVRNFYGSYLKGCTG